MTTLKIVRKGQNTVIKAVQTIITSNEMPNSAQAQVDKELMEKLRHPDLRQRVENALKDFKLCIEEGDDVCVYRMIGQTCSQDQIDDFNTSVSKLLDFLHAITIPAEEKTNGPIDEAKQVIEPATDEEIEHVKSWLEDLKDDELLCIEFISFWKNGLGHGRIAGALMKKLLTAFIQTYGQQD